MTKPCSMCRRWQESYYREVDTSEALKKELVEMRRIVASINNHERKVDQKILELKRIVDAIGERK